MGKVAARLAPTRLGIYKHAMRDGLIHEQQLAADQRTIAWQGVSLRVPATWDLGQHSGDNVEGSFRILNALDRLALHVRWRPLPGRLKLENLAQKEAEKISGLPTAKISPAPLRDIWKISSPPLDRFVALHWNDATNPDAENSQGGLLVVGVSASAEKLFMLHMPFPAEEKKREALKSALSTLRIAGREEARDWDFFDVSLTTAPQWVLDESELSVGICRLHFRGGGRWLTLRRWSAADAAMNSFSPDRETLERFLRAVYSNEFYGNRWSIDATQQPSRTGLVQWLLGPTKPGAALEVATRWFSRFRSQPRCVVVQWDAQENKICCVELDRDYSQMTDAQLTLLASLRCHWRKSQPTFSNDETLATDENARFLSGTITRVELVRSHHNAAGLVQLKLSFRRPGGLRVLRALAGLPTAEVVKERTVDLDLIGTWVWDQCQSPVSVGKIVAALEEKFRIMPFEARRSVAGYLRTLRDRGLVTLEFPEV